MGLLSRRKLVGGSRRERYRRVGILVLVGRRHVGILYLRISDGVDSRIFGILDIVLLALDEEGYASLDYGLCNLCLGEAARLNDEFLHGIED